MPTNRIRRTRAWSPDLDEYRRHQLLGGPNSVLLAGVGYLEGAARGSFDALGAVEQARILAEMKADWRRHGQQLKWAEDGECWAEREFGRP